MSKGCVNDLNKQDQLEDLQVTITSFDRIIMKASGHDNNGRLIQLTGTYAFVQLDFYSETHQRWLAPTEWVLKV